MRDGVFVISWSIRAQRTIREGHGQEGVEHFLTRREYNSAAVAAYHPAAIGIELRSANRVRGIWCSFESVIAASPPLFSTALVAATDLAHEPANLRAAGRGASHLHGFLAAAETSMREWARGNNHRRVGRTHSGRRPVCRGSTFRSADEAGWKLTGAKVPN